MNKNFNEYNEKKKLTLRDIWRNVTSKFQNHHYWKTFYLNCIATLLMVFYV